jgi:hypothetical protein
VAFGALQRQEKAPAPGERPEVAQPR